MPLAWIVLNSVKGLGPVRIKALVDRFSGADAVLRQKPADLVRLGGLTEETAAMVRDPGLLRQAEDQLKAARAENVEVLTPDHDRYPRLLREIFAPPPVLFVKGDCGVFSRHAVAIVGTRRPTGYGREAAAHLASGLADQGIVVVSGLAAGIDTVAHEACLEKKGKTVAVLGCGLDIVYPAGNRDLARRIAANGAIVSEFPPGTPPEPFNFPRRNRIIAGLSYGTVVVEAGVRSGALITAQYALQQDRDVFAVPGPIFSDRSAGTFRLIKSGAIPVRCAGDVVESIQTVRQKALELEVKAPLPPPAELLTEQEQGIVDLLSESPQRLDQVAQKSGRAMTDLWALLLNLELKGVVRQIAGQQFVRT